MRQLPEVAELSWFSDNEILPGWNVSWRMGRTKNGAFAIAELKISQKHDPVLHTKLQEGQKLTREEIRELVSPTVPGTGITARLLRRLTFRESTRYSRRAIETGLVEPPPLTPRAKRPSRRGRPKIYKDQWYRQLAKRYLQIEIKSQLAESYPEYAELSAVGLRSAIRRCRLKHYLPPTRQGMATCK
jgi:hypothetical protein